MGRCSTCAVWTATVSTPELVFAALESLRPTADLVEGSVQRFIPDPRAKVSGNAGPRDGRARMPGTVNLRQMRNHYPSGRKSWLVGGSSTATPLAFTGLTKQPGVAVDSVGNVYVADSGNNRVLKLPAG
jgi:hypothetical protein